MTPKNRRRFEIAYVLVAVLFAATLLMSARAKLAAPEELVAAIHERFGIPMSGIGVLAAFDIAGAIALVAGIWRPSFGIAAGIGLAVYALVVILAHLWVGDSNALSSLITPVLLAIAALVLRLWSTQDPPLGKGVPPQR